ncbi:hypothetical protein GOP47_0027039 [Adiantum capillus-veneris]|nr:hypothetical protein GOP47_0027039 [Adiantum capillus-veneris]
MRPLFFPLFKHSRAFSSFAILAHESLPSSIVPKGHKQASHAHSRPFDFKLGFGVSAGASVLCFLLFLLLRLLKYRRKWRQNRAALAKYPQISPIKLKIFAYRELKAATQGFNGEHKLGQGGFGAVYKGILKDGKEVAVKKLTAGSFQGEREFQNELSVIGHVFASPHIVPLVGFCSNGKQRLLVYEYMHNHSLQEALFDEDYPGQLHWDKRFAIMLDTCKALAFLHACEPPIVHGDIKPSNVLLDAKFCAKVADFGLARFKTTTSTEQSDVRDEAVYLEEPKIRNHRRGVAEKHRKHMKKDALVATTDGVKEKPDVTKLEVVETQSNSTVFTTSPELSETQSISMVFTTSPESDASSSLIGKLVCDSSQARIDCKHDSLLSDSDIATCSSPSSVIGKLVCDSSQASIDCKHDSLLSDSDIATCSSPLPETDKELDIKEHNQVTLESMAHDFTQKNDISDIEAENKDASTYEETGVAYCCNEVEFAGSGTWKEKQNSAFSKDWWWRQESSGELSSKDFVIGWMGHEDIKRPYIKESVPLGGHVNCEKEACLNKNSRPSSSSQRGLKERRECLRSLEQQSSGPQEERDLQQAQEDVVLHVDVEKEEMQRQSDGRLPKKESSRITSNICATRANDIELKESVHSSWRSASLQWWRNESIEEASSTSLKSKKINRRESSKSREWWKDEDAASSKEWKAMKKKREHALSREWSGELSSRVVSSTPSMRGTLCYIAPENCGNGVMSSEKSDVYSFGVLLLVVISGRRPLQVTASPISDFERANLISWARHLAHSGNVLELVDPSLQGKFCRKQATLSITVALLCLERLPSKRPCMIDVQKMLSGGLEVPSLPFHFSSSRPCRVQHSWPSTNIHCQYGKIRPG